MLKTKRRRFAKERRLKKTVFAVVFVFLSLLFVADVVFANERDELEAFLVINKYRRPYRYMYIGGGGIKSDSFTQGTADTERQTSGAATVGIDLSGKILPLSLELRGNFAFSPSSGETAMFTYINIPYQWFWRKRLSPEISQAAAKMEKDLNEGRPWGTVMLENQELVKELCGYVPPLRFEFGIGYMGINYALDDGNVIDYGRNMRQKTTGMVAGLAYAGRVMWFGENNLLRFTGYYLDSKRAENGGEFEDKLLFPGSKMEMYGQTRGRIIEGKLDWYYRSDKQISKGGIPALLSGWGLSLIGRKITIREGRTSNMRTMPLFFPVMVETIFPEQKVYQIELLATVGFMM